MSERADEGDLRVAFVVEDGISVVSIAERRSF